MTEVVLWTKENKKITFPVPSKLQDLPDTLTIFNPHTEVSKFYLRIRLIDEDRPVYFQLNQKPSANLH